jgi:hypothetical protein
LSEAQDWVYDAWYFEDTDTNWTAGPISIEYDAGGTRITVPGLLVSLALAMMLVH